ncbi:glycosyltransferase [Fervidobacterium nodosum]|uniref:sucrose-phosphate synthase n=1 Tax=Fervidobacterium nodosum (strain ATCC 35602 / DSM 5306 / Rt17-B1) TaxID=381764 RepID=A7HK78_FERNB|nr:glycosyltransferase [Fervidobacterium nodosum]ABS60311.1 Sucrose-phosphate synthase [Fervidobacterium nodosum Rt17-B1]
MKNIVKRIAFFNPQGNFDKNDSHLTEHPDFGGQLVYVKELAKAITSKGIQVDIITRQIIDKDWPEFSEPFDYYPDSPNVRIVRIPFGGEKFLRKEDLWKYLPEYVDRIYELYEKEGEFPDFVTTHYADGGISGVLFFEKTGIPFSFTGHSLGAWKLEKMLKNGFDQNELEKKYRFSVRILAENLSIKYSSFIVCSTSQERYEQYSHKLYTADPYSDKFKVIPPGINHKIFNTEVQSQDGIIEKYVTNVLSKTSVGRQKLPFIIMSSRIDRKKNHIAVVRAFLNNEKLKKSANLIIVVRGIDDVLKFIDENNNEEAEILREIVNESKGEIGKSIFFLNIADQQSLAALYRIGAKRHSVFVLPALYEPFGLAIVEAAACGLVVVATKNGGPLEILSNNEGLLIDPEDIEDISHKLYIGLTQFDNSKSIELAKRYTWENTAEKYLENILNSINNSKDLKDINVNVEYIKNDVKNFIEKIKNI